MHRFALVTGGNGFIGSHLIEALLKRGYRVRCLVRRTSNLKWIDGLKVEYVEGDVSNKSGLDEALKGVHVVYHVAGVTKALTREGYDLVNWHGTRNLVEICSIVNRDVERIVIMSSLAASGPSSSHRPSKEEDPPRPVSDYGRSKLLGEQEALKFAHTLPITILRPAAVYGPRDRDIYAFFRLIKNRLNFKIGNEERYISLCHVMDVVNGAILAGEKDVPSGEAFFISDGEIHSWGDVTSLLAEIMKVKPLELRISPSLANIAATISELTCRMLKKPPLFNRQKLMEMRECFWTCDITKAREMLGFRPSINIREGLMDTFIWYRKNGWL
jgi:nucleoside-diphosphate-sugar epimerase